jgi:hypothetical protein
MRKMMGWKEMKNAEQWCFSIGKTDEKVADNQCFSNGRKMKGCWCFSKVVGVSTTGKVAANGVAAEEGGKRNKCWTELFRE